MFTTVCSAAVYGLQAYLVRVEVDLAGGLPSFQLVGSLGSEVKESRERVSVAMKNSGLPKYISNFPYFTGFPACALAKRYVFSLIFALMR